MIIGQYFNFALIKSKPICSSVAGMADVIDISDDDKFIGLL